MIPKKTHQNKEGFLTLVVLLLVVGAFVLALDDPESRAAFLDIAKVGVSGFIGWMMPRQ